MKVIGYLVDGLKIVGFQLENNKGVVKNVSYDKTMTFALQKKIDGVSCQKVENTNILVGIDYQKLSRVSIKDSLDFRIEDNKVYVGEDKLSDKDVWNCIVDGSIKSESLNVGLDIENSSKIIYMGGGL